MTIHIAPTFRFMDTFNPIMAIIGKMRRNMSITRPTLGITMLSTLLWDPSFMKSSESQV